MAQGILEKRGKRMKRWLAHADPNTRHSRAHPRAPLSRRGFERWSRLVPRARTAAAVPGTRLPSKKLPSTPEFTARCCAPACILHCRQTSCGDRAAITITLYSHNTNRQENTFVLRSDGELKYYRGSSKSKHTGAQEPVCRGTLLLSAGDFCLEDTLPSLHALAQASQWTLAMFKPPRKPEP